MTALERAIEWKLKFIKEMIRVIKKVDMPDDDKSERIKQFENEKKVLKGGNKGEAWEVAKENLKRWIRAAKSKLKESTDGHEIVSWNDIIKEREKLLNDLLNEGKP